MCRIDEPFGSHPLEEKKNPTERFQQIVIESELSPLVQDLIVKHFIASCGHELGGLDSMGKVLRSAGKATGDVEQVCRLVHAMESKHGNWFGGAYFGIPDTPFRESLLKQFPGRFAFANDVARNLFPDSPYGFYQCFKGSISVRFEVFILLYATEYYGADCHLFPLLFKDEQLKAISAKERKNLLWDVFEHLTMWDCTFPECLEDLYAWGQYAIVPKRETLLSSQKLDRAFKYLEGWMATDSQFIEFTEAHALYFEFYEYLINCKSKINRQKIEWAGIHWPEDELKQYKSWAAQWLDNKNNELKKAWCNNVPLGNLHAEDLETWARYAYEIYMPLCPELSQEQAEILASYGIQKDFDRWLKPGRFLASLLEDGDKSRLWYVSSHRELWKGVLLRKMGALTVADRFQLLRRNLGYSIRMLAGQHIPHFIDLPEELLETRGDRGDEFYVWQVDQEDRDWWDTLFRGVPDEEGFPKELYPYWTVEKLKRFSYAGPLASDADKSLGIVRGEISRGGAQFDSETLEKLLRILQFQAPEKALRNYLMLLRHSSQPFTTNTLDHDRKSLCPWTMMEILQRFMAEHFDEPSRRHLLADSEWDSEEFQLMVSLRSWFAQYCMSRLQLRKGERVNDESYNPEQAVEPSSFWRQGYLKALAELGVDLNGKVHKTVYFTRKFDPDPDVRAVAQECYKAVRREHNKSETAADIRRGLVAAHWWLLLVQRQGLGAEIDYEEAKQTRRRLLRRP